MISLSENYAYWKQRTGTRQKNQHLEKRDILELDEEVGMKTSACIN